MKKRLFCAVLAAMMIVLMLPIQALAAESIEEVYVGREFDSVIGTAVDATKFSYSGKIPDGLTLSGSYHRSNKYGAEILSIRLSGTPTVAGTYSFEVKCKNNSGTVTSTLSYTVTVGADAPFDRFDPNTFSIDAWPTKTTYYLGDTLDTTGLKVTATVYKWTGSGDKYKEYPNYDITNLCWCDPTIFTFDEAQNVTVSCTLPNLSGVLETVSDTFRVDFKYADANTVTGVAILAKPTKLTYTVGETLDTSGLTLRLTKGSGATEDVTTGFTCDVTKLDTVGTQTVTVTYGEKTATFTVTVTEAVSSVPSSSSSSAPASSSVPESSSEPVSESSSEPESSESESSEPESSVPESSSEPEPSSESEPVIDVDVEPEPEETKGGIPFWVWIIIGLLVIAVGAAVGLFLIGRKNIDE
ncbi:MAG: bacterial Ig-like domain-containing protein [Oscillospiraceae bacterium]